MKSFEFITYLNNGTEIFPSTNDIINQESVILSILSYVSDYNWEKNQTS